MRPLTHRKLCVLNARLVLLVLLLMALLPATALGHLDRAQAQDGQPEDTRELFQPFWEAWDLLHANYVDPLDDAVLAAGAVEGLVRAAAVPDFDPAQVEIAAAGEESDPFALLWAVWALLHAQAQLLPDDNALMEGALRGMLAALGDPHTDYMDPETFARVNESVSGEYEGIGAMVRQNEDIGGLELVSIFEGSPAERAGLRAGDVIVRVEGRDVTVLSQNEIIAMVRGPAGTLVRLGIQRPGITELLKFEVVRGKIAVPSVRSELLEGGYGYVRLSQFDSGSAQELRAALGEIDADTLPGLILDLRGNPGGYLTTSIEVASLFLDDETIVVERGPGREIAHKALGNPIAGQVPMVVLVDQGSASASELIAGALQDHGRATIVGMQTFGKGSVQTWRDLSNGGGIRITISRWYTPDGHSVSEVGITPDVVVPYQPEEVSGDPDNQLTAALQVLNGTATLLESAPEDVEAPVPVLP